MLGTGLLSVAGKVTDKQRERGMMPCVVMDQSWRRQYELTLGLPSIVELLGSAEGLARKAGGKPLLPSSSSRVFQVGSPHPLRRKEAEDVNPNLDGSR